MLFQLSDKQKQEAVSVDNKYFTWLSLGKPTREVTAEECFEHYLKYLFEKHGSAAFAAPSGVDEPMFI